MRMLAFLFGMMFLAQTGHAQVNNPTQAVFVASPDHSVVVNGTAVLTNYQLDIMVGTATGALAVSQNLGKPTPAQTTNEITSDISPVIQKLTSGTYVAFVSAVGPGGAGKSPASDPFGRITAAGAPSKPSIR